MTRRTWRIRNPLWELGGIPIILLGSLLLLFGIAMYPIEISRIYRGSLNRGDHDSYFLYPNYNSDRNRNSPQIQQFLPDFFIFGKTQSILQNKGVVGFDQDVNGVNVFPVQDKYLWPWSHAALLFGLITIIAGGLGILAGYRRTYTSTFAFFLMSLLSGFLSIFLVVYYAVQVYWQLNRNNNRRKSFTPSSLDYSLGAVMLALSCAALVFSFISAIYSGLALAICCGSKARFDNPKPMRKQAFIPKNFMI